MAHNYHSKDTVIRELSESDLFDGIYVQAFANTTHIYQMKKIGGIWCYRATHRVSDKTDKYSSIDECVKGDDILHADWIKTTSTKTWCITVFSVRLTASFRNEKIDSILD